MAVSAGEDFDLEGSLVPLLDLVLQMVMFFMLCANFVMEQVNETIRLPEATAAKSLDKSIKDVLFVNIDKDGKILRNDGDGRALGSRLEFDYWFKERFRDSQARQALLKSGSPNDQKGTLVIIRAHAAVQFKFVMDVLESCRAAGFQNLQLRATIKGSGT